MASSTYSGTPQPPQRIRIVTHSPLAPLRAWLPLPTASSSRDGGPPTVRDLVGVIKGMLKAEREEFEVELQGFALLEDSPLNMLDPTNDILDIKARSQPQPASVEAKPPVLSTSTAAAAHLVPLPPSSSSASTSSSSSASSSSSSDSDSSDSDSDSTAAPEVLSSKRPLPLTNGHAASAAHGNGNGNERPAKRQRRDSSSSSSSSSASSSGYSSSTSSMASSSDEGLASASRPPQPLNGIVQKPMVPPGSGMMRTKKRNQRKRVLKAARAREKAERELEALKEGRGAQEGAQKDEEARKEEKMDVDTSPAKAAPPPTTAVPSISAAPTLQSTAASTTAAKRPLPDPYSDFLPSPSPSASARASPSTSTLSTGGEPGLSTVGAGFLGRKHSAGLFFSEPQAAALGGSPLRSESGGPKGKWKKNQRRNGGDQEQAGRAPSSPEYHPESPDVSFSAEALPGPLTGTRSLPPLRPTKTTARQPFVPPNKRSDLPPWMVVTSVNVEGKNWEAGVGRRVRGTSRNWVQREEEEEGEGETEEEYAGWEGWMSSEAVERRWEGLRKIGKDEAREGIKVATKVLELDPATFNPTLSLKYGSLLAASATSSLRIRLHPSCLVSAADEEDYGEDDGYFDEDDEYGGKVKPKFGQELVLDGEEAEGDEAEEGIWAGEWDGADVRLVA
ncbi:hypothetical protein JCM1840_002445 [Sporobolomyces johnsonii]